MFQDQELRNQLARRLTVCQVPMDFEDVVANTNTTSAAKSTSSPITSAADDGVVVMPECENWRRSI